MSQSAVTLQSAVKVLDAAELFPSMVVRKMLLCILVTVKTTHSFLHNIWNLQCPFHLALH